MAVLLTYMSSRAVILLGAGTSQVHTIHKVQKLDLLVIAVDQNPDAPGFVYADAIINVSTYDAENIIAELELLIDEFTIVSIINASSGQPVITAAKLANKLGLGNYPIDMAETVIHKSKMIQFCKKNNISVPSLTVYEQGDIINEREVSFPLIIKPSLSLVGKSGVFKIENFDNLCAKLPISAKISLDGHVNIEEYIDGRDVSFLSFVKDGKILFDLLLDEINGVDDDGLHYGRGYAIPSIYANTPIQNEVRKLAEELIRIFKLQTTSFNFSCRISENRGPVLIEIHLEIGGDLVWDVLIPAGINLDVLSLGLGLLSDAKTKSELFTITPSAVLYDKGHGLVTDRPYEVIYSASRDELEGKIMEIKNYE
jgi:carbamoylphosphate synthase large subunit